MPNGVIWGGAVDGSNQLGAMVTCQAMVTWPEGCCEAAGTVATRTATAVRSERTIERRQGRIADRITMFLPCVTAAYTLLERSYLRVPAPEVRFHRDDASPLLLVVVEIPARAVGEGEARLAVG